MGFGIMGRNSAMDALCINSFASEKHGFCTMMGRIATSSETRDERGTTYDLHDF